MTDDELRAILKTWAAPAAPASLRKRVLRPRFSLRWILTGQVRVPVPVLLAILCVLMFAAYRTMRPTASSLSDFEQVREFQPRIVRTIHEAR